MSSIPSKILVCAGLLAAACDSRTDRFSEVPLCRTPVRPQSPIQLERAFPALTFDQPVQLAPSPDGAWWYVIERPGRVLRFAAQEPDHAETVLDISAKIDMSGDDGLVGIALHPAFATTGELFLSYATPSTTAAITSRVSRFRSDDGGATIAPETEEVVLELEQSHAVHVNGEIRFGPDGYLYIGFGDGASPELEDPERRLARDAGSWRGKILRIDVDGERPYAIPRDNPFAEAGGAPEVWALGLRNPWRFSFDRENGDLWAGDVGWSAFEEIDRILPAGDYGWPVYEGPSCLDSTRCSDPAILPPVLSLFHDQARSLTMGFVYRGQRIPALRGKLVFGDFVTGFLWSLDPRAAGPSPQVISSDGHTVVSFAEDKDGELYLVDLIEGTLWRVAPGDNPGAPVEAPPTLAATGCFTGTTPSPNLIPYDVNWPFWSDGADKRRWIALPEGTTVGHDGTRLEFPRGTVFVKEFAFGETRIETRLLVHHDDDVWAGYTYVWRADQTDADLVPLSAAPIAAGWPQGYWYYPARTQCVACHNAAAGHAIGMRLLQLDLPELARLQDLGTIAHEVPPHLVLPRVDDTSVPTATRARAWLHANCANCHRPGAPGVPEIDLRFGASDMHACDRPPTRGALGIVDARIVAPGDPARSVLLARIRAGDTNRMPPGPSGFGLVDEAGAALVEQWIRELPATCALPVLDPD